MMAGWGGVMRAALVGTVVAGSSAAAGGETLLSRAVSCRASRGELGRLMDRLAAEDVGMKSAVHSFAAPSGMLYRLSAPVEALGFSAGEIYVSPGRIAMVLPDLALASVSSRLRLSRVPYGPAERRIDAGRRVIAYQLGQEGLVGTVLVGCQYSDRAALGWLGPEEGF